MKRDFWRSAGQHLLRRSAEGWLTVTPDYLRAYWQRPEVEPLQTSCPAELALHKALMADPLRPVSPAELRQIADDDVAENYRAVLAFRGLLTETGSIEGAYLKLIRTDDIVMPPVFVDQLVHVIVRNMMDDATDPIRLRVAELFFRHQIVTRTEERVLLADEETVDMHARAGDVGITQLIAEPHDPRAPARAVEMTVLDAANQHIYWDRSDRFDTIVDVAAGQPALDDLARVMEQWLQHMLGVTARIEPRQKLDDQDWRWHIGLDADATRILNALYEGITPSADTLSRLLGLFRMELAADTPVQQQLRGRPIYLGLAMSPRKRCIMRPQNLLINLPLSRTS
jgi:hypothetical protein